MSQTQADEKIKHRNALELERQKWAYKKEELQYVEAGQHLRSLNQLMWQVPSLAIALTGGLWYGATLVSDEITRRFLLALSAGVDLLTIITLLRLRSVIGAHIAYQKQFAGATSQDKDRFRYTVIACWSVALVAAACGGVFGVYSPSHFDKKDAGNSPMAPLAPIYLQQTLEIPSFCGPRQVAPLHKRKKCTR